MKNKLPSLKTSLNEIISEMNDEIPDTEKSPRLNSKIVPDKVVAPFLSLITRFGVEASIDAFRDALGIVAEPGDDDESEGMKAYIAVDQMEDVTGRF